MLWGEMINVLSETTADSSHPAKFTVIPRHHSSTFLSDKERACPWSEEWSIIKYVEEEWNIIRYVEEEWNDTRRDWDYMHHTESTEDCARKKNVLTFGPLSPLTEVALPCK